MKSKIAPILNLVEADDKLKPLTKRRPVASLPFACRYRLIDFPFSCLYNAEAESAALFISGSGHSLYDHMRSGSAWGLDSLAGGGVFTHSNIKLKLGTNPDKKHDKFYYEDHYNYVAKSRAEYVYMLGANMLSNVQVDSLMNYHVEKESDLTVVYKNVVRESLIKETESSAFDINGEDNSLIESIHFLTADDTQEQSVNINMNMMLLKKEIFLEYLEKAKENDLDVNVDNLVQFALEDNRLVYGYEYTGYLKVIEDVLSYYQAHMDMLDEEKFNALFFRANPIRTRAKNSAPTYYGESAVIQNSQFANDCQIYGTVKHSLIFRKVTVAKDSHIEDSIVMQGAVVEEGAYLKHVILDKNVHIKKGVRLEGTAENPIVIEKSSTISPEGEN